MQTQPKTGWLSHASQAKQGHRKNTGPGHPAAEQESQRPTANSTPRFIPFPNIKHPPAWSQIVPAGLLPGLLCLLRQPFGPRLPRGPGLEQLGPPSSQLGKPNTPSSTLLEISRKSRSKPWFTTLPSILPGLAKVAIAVWDCHAIPSNIVDTCK